MSEKRGKFSSSFGFIMAATGSAVGLGNLWKFPYIAGENGGGIFFLFYILFVLVLGVPILLCEMALGRKTRQNPIGAYKKINKKFTFAGVIGVFCAIVILAYYSVIGGWILKYVYTYMVELFAKNSTGINDAVTFYNGFISNSGEAILWHLLFMAFTFLIVINGVSKGIEKASKVLLPALFVLILVVVIRSVTLKGGMSGISYLFVPKFSDVNSLEKISTVMLAAMGQVFFSLSIGVGTMITYGSYLDESTNISKSAITVPVLDTLMAILSGMAIMPAVFAFSLEPSSGPGLLFETLPVVFLKMPFGTFFGLIFFILVFVAAITSAVSLLEVVTAFLIDNLHLKRFISTSISALVIAFIGIFAAMSFGVLSDVTVLGKTIFSAMTFLSDNLLMPLGGLLLCFFVGYVWKTDNAILEITSGGITPFKYKMLFVICTKYVAPICIILIFVTSLLN